MKISKQHERLLKELAQEYKEKDPEKFKKLIESFQNQLDKLGEANKSDNKFVTDTNPLIKNNQLNEINHIQSSWPKSKKDSKQIKREIMQIYSDTRIPKEATAETIKEIFNERIGLLIELEKKHGLRTTEFISPKGIFKGLIYFFNDRAIIRRSTLRNKRLIKEGFFRPYITKRTENVKRELKIRQEYLEDVIRSHILNSPIESMQKHSDEKYKVFSIIYELAINDPDNNNDIFIESYLKLNKPEVKEIVEECISIIANLESSEKISPDMIRFMLLAFINYKPLYIIKSSIPSDTINIYFYDLINTIFTEKYKWLITMDDIEIKLNKHWNLNREPLKAFAFSIVNLKKDILKIKEKIDYDKKFLDEESQVNTYLRTGYDIADELIKNKAFDYLSQFPRMANIPFEKKTEEIDDILSDRIRRIYTSIFVIRNFLDKFNKLNKNKKFSPELENTRKTWKRVITALEYEFSEFNLDTVSRWKALETKKASAQKAKEIGILKSHDRIEILESKYNHKEYYNKNFFKIRPIEERLSLFCYKTAEKLRKFYPDPEKITKMISFLYYISDFTGNMNLEKIKTDLENKDGKDNDSVKSLEKYQKILKRLEATLKE